VTRVADGAQALEPRPAGRPPARVHVAWAGEHRFDAGRPGGPALRLDGSGRTGQSMVDAVLSALAGCTAVDVVDILAKRRTPVEALAIDAVGERFEGTPGRLVRIHLTYRLRGAGVERAHAERAIELAVTKYCSVRDSLDPAIPVEWTLELEAPGGAAATSPSPTSPPP
jgi:putative redox protein